MGRIEVDEITKSVYEIQADDVENENENNKDDEEDEKENNNEVNKKDEEDIDDEEDNLTEESKEDEEQIDDKNHIITKVSMLYEKIMIMLKIYNRIYCTLSLIENCRFDKNYILS